MIEQERQNISQLIRSTESHELGMLLAYESGYAEKYNWDFRIDYWYLNVKYEECYPDDPIYDDEEDGHYENMVQIRLGNLYIVVAISVSDDWHLVGCGMNYDNERTYKTQGAKLIVDENLKIFTKSHILKRNSTVEMLFHEVLRIIKNNQKEFENLIDQPCKTK